MAHKPRGALCFSRWRRLTAPHGTQEYSDLLLAVQGDGIFHLAPEMNKVNLLLYKHTAQTVPAVKSQK
ncbi:hypothetical protein TRIATDRAFT_284242 [Trichoderma atroviride IMI 206040]|uniref:Uncharacterized protein n=1 Tax=Hypocrea atroviridis (strain ATCC 20476 / IMI 206040) TaxID=452589 RepID=G9NWD5_HYPAI|nr:uncharacterized protein TRIATDRAFT_284242 [Trichoderma atroviride IMI 206040]EHK45295.1 hypothetical protein TRIATDRAFT_284242 [Trichoderma atroviride IMI 206040]